MTEHTPVSSVPTPRPRHLGMMNGLGTWTLFLKEVRRFLKVYLQTLIAPAVGTLLYVTVFALSVGSLAPPVHGVPFTVFLAPGLMMMAMVQNAFANTASSLIIAKVQGNIVDFLMPPLSALEQTIAMAMGGVVRGLLVGLVVAVAIMPFISLPIFSVGLIIFHAFGGVLMLSLLGMLAGIWAHKFDHLASVTNFVIVPLSFLSGTFYSVDRLPETLHAVVAWGNPFFHMIDGFRCGFTGHIDGSILGGIVMIAGVNLVLLVLTWYLLDRGHKLRT